MYVTKEQLLQTVSKTTSCKNTVQKKRKLKKNKNQTKLHTFLG